MSTFGTASAGNPNPNNSFEVPNFLHFPTPLYFALNLLLFYFLFYTHEILCLLSLIYYR